MPYLSGSSINQTAIEAIAAQVVASALSSALSAKADLQNGIVPAAQLPSYVDDVLEFATAAAFPAVGEAGKIYLDVATSLTYRWIGSGYVPVNPSLALGETASTAYRGDRGAVAYTHSQSAHAPPNANYYVHPSTHSASMITQDASYRFVSDGEKSYWNGKSDAHSHPYLPTGVLFRYDDNVNSAQTGRQICSWNDMISTHMTNDLRTHYTFSTLAGVAGHIDTTLLSTAYVTSSDARLKNSRMEELTDDLIDGEWQKLLQTVYLFSWKHDPENKLVLGYNATVACEDNPICGLGVPGHGPKDAEIGSVYLDESGVERTVTPASVDQGKVTSLLALKIAQQEKRIQELESRNHE